MDKQTKINYFYYYHIVAYFVLIGALYGQSFVGEFFWGEIIQFLHLFLLIITLPINFISLALVYFGSASLLSITIVQGLFFVISLLIFNSVVKESNQSDEISE
ncbi:hypothetical protein [Sphingobacterium tabacisoli]|uniref:Uncharacterized protein n=1 Tax=Sphingobacterium tabacisoli TaxID=2044855 RepID=A0ABW5LAX8_9SPHI|nr:hypothetical protein [Sphingobacterium tabacisoli]